MRRDRGAFRLCRLLSVASIFIACDEDATGPGHPLADTYVLEQVNGAALPYWQSSENVRPVAWLAETLAFSPSGEVVRVRTLQLRLEGRDTTFTEVLEQQYRVEGSDIQIGQIPCPPDFASVCLRDRGTLTEDGLELEAYSALFADVEVPTFVYTKVGS